MAHKCTYDDGVCGQEPSGATNDITIASCLEALRIFGAESKANTKLIAAKDAEIAGLREGYAEAIEDIESWSVYASEYFQNKHDLAGCIAMHKAILAKHEGDDGS